LDEKTSMQAVEERSGEAPAIRYLEAERVRLWRHGAYVRMCLDGELCVPRTAILRTCPMTDPDAYISFRDGAGNEIGIVRDPSELDEDSRGIVQAELRRRYVLPVIRQVVKVNRRFGTTDWEVDTDRGVVNFTTRRLRDNIVVPSPGRYVITDVEENRYDIPDLHALDPASQAMFLEQL
jgi:hypothetical protein